MSARWFVAGFASGVAAAVVGAGMLLGWMGHQVQQSADRAGLNE